MNTMSRLVLGMGVVLACMPAVADTEIEQRIAAARTLRANGKAGEAVAAFRAIVKDAPDNYLAQYNLGLSLIADGHNADAVPVLENAIKLREAQHGTDVTIYNTLGWTQLQLGQADAALKQFESGLSFLDQLPDASKSRLLNNYGLALMQVLRYDDAEKVLTRASAEFHNPLAARNLDSIKAMKNAQVQWGVVFGADKTLDEAQDQLKKARDAGFASATAVDRGTYYRSVVQFPTRDEAVSALGKIRGFQSDAYVVNMDTWCHPRPAEKGELKCNAQTAF